MIVEGKKLVISHPNAKGTGCKLTMQLTPVSDDAEGSLTLYFQEQCGCEDDYESITLSFAGVGKLLGVLLGWTETVDDGKGFCVGNIRLTFSHRIEPVAGYTFGFTTETRRYCISLSNAEALALCEALRIACYKMAF